MIDPETLPDELTIVPRKAIAFAGETYGEVRLREPNAGEMKKSAAKVGMESVIFLMFLVSGVPIGAIEQLPARDYRKGYDYLMGFMSDGPEIGAPD